MSNTVSNNAVDFYDDLSVWVKILNCINCRDNLGRDVGRDCDVGADLEVCNRSKNGTAPVFHLTAKFFAMMMMHRCSEALTPE